MAGKAKLVSDEQLADALRKAGGIKSEAAKLVKITRQAVQDRVERTPMLQQAIKDADEKLLDIAETQLVKAVNDGKGDMVRYYLDRKGKKRGYANNVNVGLDDATAAAIVASLGGNIEAYRAALAQLGADPSEIP